VEYIALAEDDQMRQEFDEEAAKAQKRSSKGWSFFPLCEELQLQQRQQQRVQRRGQEGERDGG
jgi:hypothetical protein